MKNPNSKIGLVIADTHNYSLARSAIENSVAHFEYKEVLVFTDNVALAEGYSQIKIEKMSSINEYNDLIFNVLPKYATCDFYLIIQYDGFVLNAKKFESTFLDFDYVGAVWPQYPFHKVGNGGFSLRSRKLIEASAELASHRSDGEAEDVFICRTLRPLLENKCGIKFADEETASRFAFEAAGVPGLVMDTFGFHGFLHLPRIYANNVEYLLKNLPIRTLKNRTAELIWGSLALPLNEKARFDMTLAGLLHHAS